MRRYARYRSCVVNLFVKRFENPKKAKTIKQSFIVQKTSLKLRFFFELSLAKVYAFFFELSSAKFGASGFIAEPVRLPL